MVPVILSGGVGSRLWPLSRGMYPKQLLPLIDDELSMLQQTILRTDGVPNIKPPIIVCNNEHRFMVGEQISRLAITEATILLEQDGRNTAPAIALAAFEAMKKGDDPILIVMPADHVIANQAQFHSALLEAQTLAEQGDLVTFGVLPQGPETGYGYIRTGKQYSDNSYDVAGFKEKPSKEVAQQYIESGEYYWNGGIFVFKASVYLEELKAFEPGVYAATHKAHVAASADLDFIRADANSFAESPSISIDYAVMERTNKAKVVTLDAGWNDVGSWSALWEVSTKDENGNSVKGDVLLHNTKNSHIYTENKLVSVVGVNDLVIAVTDDAVMVAPRDQSQDVKELVKKLKDQKRSHVSHHRKVYRPWGWYDSIDYGERFQVKRIQVKPNARLSVQMHQHRAEHWVVVKGVAEVMNGDKTFVLNENESTYIPIGATHALKNLSETEPLEIIEVQSGSYLGEDDIVRFEDNYGRA